MRAGILHFWKGKGTKAFFPRLLGAPYGEIVNIYRNVLRALRQRPWGTEAIDLCCLREVSGLLMYNRAGKSSNFAMLQFLTGIIKQGMYEVQGVLDCPFPPHSDAIPKCWNALCCPPIHPLYNSPLRYIHTIYMKQYIQSCKNSSRLSMRLDCHHTGSWIHTDLCRYNCLHALGHSMLLCPLRLFSNDVLFPTRGSL